MRLNKILFVGWVFTILVLPFHVSGQGFFCQTAEDITNNGTVTAVGPTQGEGCYNCSGAIHAVWYSFLAPSNGEISVSACGKGLNAADSRLWIYQGNCDALTLHAQNDDACGLLDGYAAALYNVQVMENTTYYLEWDDRWSNEGFEFEFLFQPDGINTIVEQEKEKLDLFPNPLTSEALNVETTQSGTLRVTDVRGKILVNKYLTPGQMSLDCGQLASGTYIVTLVTENEVFTKTVIK